MNTDNAILVTQLLLQAATQVQQYGALLAKSHETGEGITDEEVDECMAKDDAAKIRLQQRIDAAKRK